MAKGEVKMQENVDDLPFTAEETKQILDLRRELTLFLSKKNVPAFIGLVSVAMVHAAMIAVTLECRDQIDEQMKIFETLVGEYKKENDMLFGGDR